MEGTLRQHLQRRLGSLKTERSSFDPHWRDLNEFILPRQARFFVTDRNKGNRTSSKINDNTATLAARTLSSGMMGGLTSPSRPWFQLRTPDPDLNEFQPVKEWLALARDRMNEVFLSSNLYTTLPTAYSDLGVYGTTAFAVLEDDEDVIRCYAFPIGSYCLGASYRGTVDSFFREFQMTAGQLVGQFGKDKCSAPVKTAYDRGNYDAWFDVVHAVEPNPDADDGKMDSKFKRFRSVYYEPSNQEGLLSEKGFDEFPIMAPRWQLTGEDIYGHSPGMDALGDVKALQLEQKRKMEAIALQVKPPMVAPVTMEGKAASILPGAITYVPGQQAVADAFRPALQVQINLQHLIQDIQECQQRIKRAFFEDLFLMLANIQHGQMTAQEVAERQQEKLLLLGPVLERLNDELFDPLIDRTFKIMFKRNLLPPPPEELAGVELQVEYVSIMAQAQKLQGISGVQQLIQFGGNLVAADQSVLDNLDLDEAINVMADMLGTPPKMIRDKTARDAIRQGRAQQQQLQQRMAMAQQAAEAGKTMADTNITEPSALTAMMQQLRGGL